MSAERVEDAEAGPPRRSWLGVVVGVAATVLTLLYPLAVYFGLTHASPRAVGLIIVALVIPIALIRARRAARAHLVAVLKIPLLVLAVVLIGALLDDARFVLAMPVLINLVLLGSFAALLRGPMPVIERFARMQEDDLDEAQRRHCRQVTWAWVAFFALNAVVCAVLALVASLAVWAAYTGGIAYALMGLMFAGEYVLRQARFRRYGRGLHDRLLSRIFPPPAEDGPER